MNVRFYLSYDIKIIKNCFFGMKTSRFCHFLSNVMMDLVKSVNHKWIIDLTAWRYITPRGYVMRVVYYGKFQCGSLNFRLNLHLHPYFVYSSSKGSGESAHLPRLTRAFVARQCDKYMYQNLISSHI